MKVFLFILFVCTFQLLAIDSDAQNTVIQVNSDKISVNELIHEIESQTDYLVVYSHREIDIKREINVPYRSGKVKDFLESAFKLTDINYVFNNNYIILKTKAIDLKNTITVNFSPKQTGKKITGKVTDLSNEPLIGANVTVKGLKKGTVTDSDGNYSIEVETGQFLVFSYIGFLPQEIAIENQTIINIELSTNEKLMDEVVITGYGIALKKPTLTGAISTISDEDISRTTAVTTSGALVGKIAGLNTRQDDGRPGSTTRINIRNMGSPLFVIDGIQQNEGQFNNIDFNDIETMAVLKDASAAIYGLQAANGVIVITTKKGKKKERNSISLNARYGWQQFLEYPRPADAATYIKSYMQSDAILKNPNPKYSKEDLEKWQQGTEKNYRPFDWYDYIFTTSPQHYLGLNISGGSEKMNYYIALSNTKQESVVVNYGNFDRTNVHISLESEISKRLKVGATMSGRIEKKENPGVPGDDIKAPFLALYRNLPTIRPYANDNPKYPAKTSSYGDSNFAILNYKLSGRAEETFRVAQLNFNVEYELLKGLKAKGLFSYFYSQKYSDIHEYTYKLYSYDEATDTYPEAFSMDNPFMTRTVYRKEEIKGQLQLMYEKKIGSHQIDAVIGAESFKKDNPEFFIHSIPPSNSINLFDYQSLDKFTDNGNRTEARLGYIGRLNYNYAQRYLLEVSARYDGSWKFPPGDRWGFFPSVSGGWRVSEENFWQNSKFSSIFSDIKLRASYGLLGDDMVSDYAAFDYLNGYNYYKTGSVINGKYYIGAEPRGLPVTSISWIRAKIFDVGIDFGFFKNQLTGSLDYFNRKRTGLPDSRYDVLIPGEAGFSLPKENLNSDLHRGMDGSLIWRKLTGEFKYSVGGNFTYSRQYNWHKYKPRFGNSWDEYRNTSEERFTGISWGYQAIGQFQSWEEIAAYTIDNDRQGNKTLRPGDIKYKDVNNDNIINAMDARPIGYTEGSLPLLNYGFNFSFQWKNFDLAFDLTGSSFATWTQDRELRVPFTNGGNSPQYTMSDQWHLADPSDASSELIAGKYPTMLVGNGSHSNYWGSTFWVHNVNYIKLRNLEFGYTIPTQILMRMGVNDLRVYVSGQNLFYLTNVDGIDPEITSNSGIQYPTTRIVSLGVNIKF
ncbi:TonB-dependent receptor [Dysgonomonas sp. Marseille-P4677]|uniref:TonB-dependent receptor n=1 Tax=Dysgonomonas sp. Marseille-P4677 TaxID=2364790 RepID=UPI0019113EE3|nr:TonB-dependent receptor [Dysgonomonas sp. Marseille-P4677]MBK5722712.1 TonB-dependent receptor [Dysgonomonas sp. Marseille-P4677]